MGDRRSPARAADDTAGPAHAMWSPRMGRDRSTPDLSVHWRGAGEGIASSDRLRGSLEDERHRIRDDEAPSAVLGPALGAGTHSYGRIISSPFDKVMFPFGPPGSRLANWR